MVLVVKNPPINVGDRIDSGSILGSGRSTEKDMATHSRAVAWRIPWTEEPGGLQSMEPQRVGHDWAASMCRVRMGARPLLPHFWEMCQILLTLLWALVCFCSKFTWLTSTKKWLASSSPDLWVPVTCWMVRNKPLNSFHLRQHKYPFSSVEYFVN